MVRLAGRLLLAALFALLADALLYGYAPGAGLALYALLAGATVAAYYGRRLGRAGWLLALWLALAFGAIVDETLIGRILLVMLGWTILAYVYLPRESVLFDALVRGSVGGVRSFSAAPRDARNFTLLEERRLLRNRIRRVPTWVYALPLFLIALFASLIIPANLVLARWWEDAFEGLGRLFINITLTRLFFWIAFGLGSYGLLRFRLGRRPPPVQGAQIEPASPADESGDELRACVLTFAGLNIVYFAANATDAMYLWLSAKLPPGITYAQFAHQGSYRLIVAVVLAALTVTAFFRLQTLQSRDARARLLAYVFVAQNILVLLGASRRLQLYVEVYGLTRWRVATFLWLALVLVGFVLFWIKITQVRPLSFLVNANAAATVMLLSLVSFMNIDGYIAHWNVFGYQAGTQSGVDVAYLGELDAGALPALARLAQSADPQIAASARTALARMRAAASQQNAHWQSWTWRRAEALADAPQ